MVRASDDSGVIIYAAEYRKGAFAADNDQCPYPIWQLGRRCAWFAGYWDARREGY